jgi:hypothetical protein
MMRSPTARLSGIGGALIVIGVLLAVAIYVGEQMRGSGETPSLAAVGVRSEAAPVAPVIPLTTVLERADATENGRARILVHALIPQPAEPAHVEAELKRLADTLYQDNPGICAMAILGYFSQAQRASLGEDAPWVLLWSPDGLGWNGDRERDFEKHLQGPPTE